MVALLCNAANARPNAPDTPIAGATLLVERDGFSGEGAEDLDNRTYWIPIGTTTADSEGNYCFTAPAGRIRVTALTGDFDSSSDLITIQSGELDVYSMNLDIIGQNPGDRIINPIKPIKAFVNFTSNSFRYLEKTWDKP